MSAADRAIIWLFANVIPRSIHRHLPHWIKVLLNRWMRHLGDPPTDRGRP